MRNRWDIYVRILAGLLIAALFAVSCGDDGSVRAVTTDGTTTSTTTQAGPGPDGAPATSTTIRSDCLELVEEYVDATRRLFATDAPSDVLLEATNSRLTELDSFAAAGGCGESYRVGVCDGLDELTLSGTLVIYQMLTASCI